jgi:UDP-N-acetylmuramoyl-L-alanyl-D-glutamate--2,6-diaminopimelate ligase
MQLNPLLSGYPTINILGVTPQRITGFSSNSKLIKPGYLYICIRGEKQDGHHFVGEAVRNGALAVVSEKPLIVTIPVICVANTRHFLSYFADRFYGRPSRHLHVTGITGTNGKTTTAHFLYHIYQSAGINGALMGTVGVKAGNHYLKQSLTTPGAEELHKTLWQLAKNKITHVATEVSSHALVQKRVEHCRFGTAVFTNLTQDHLDYHGSMEQYFLAKAHLFRLLIKSPQAKAIINADDRRSTRLQSLTTNMVLLYGMADNAQIKIEEILLLTEGGSFVRLQTPLGQLSFIVYLPGRHNVYNAIAAVASALSQGIDIHSVTRGIESLRHVPGRLEQLPSPPDVKVYLDYAHTPDGLEKVLQALYEMPHRKIISVFGCRGNRDRGKRPIMGSVAASYADTVILTADNPANENPAHIACEIARDMSHTPLIIPDRQQAIHQALSLARSGDIVLITGKGHENYQIVGETALSYSDIQSVASYYQH